MTEFKKIESEDPIQEVIKSAFDTNFAVSGGWGYNQALATSIHHSDIPIAQFEHVLASMRAYLEMNMTLPKEERFGSINLNETQREQTVQNSLIYDKVTYEITALKEDLYEKFINDYKEGYGKEEFDMTEHFNQRKKATLHRTVEHWFEVSQII